MRCSVFGYDDVRTYSNLGILMTCGLKFRIGEDLHWPKSVRKAPAVRGHGEEVRVFFFTSIWFSTLLQSRFCC